MAAQHEEGYLLKKKSMIRIYFLVCVHKGLTIDTTSGCRGTPCFRRYGRELVLKPPISLKEKLGGRATYRRTDPGTAGRGSSRYRYRGHRRTHQKASWIANAIELNRHTTVHKNTWKCMVSLKLYFSPHCPPEDSKKNIKKNVWNTPSTPLSRDAS